MNKLKDLLKAIKPVRDILLLDFIEDDIFKHYFQYFRHYHTYHEHIIPGLELFETIRGLCKEPNLVELAWWYHDVIYIPGASDSERVSADKARFDCAQLGYGQKIASIVYSLVMATQHFKTEPHTQDEKFIHDLDLVILGSEPEKYEKYEKLIRKEYSFVKEKAFYQGRLQVLEHFISQSGSPTSTKKSLFKTPYFIDTYEKKAIDNILHKMNAIEKIFFCT